MGVLSHPAYSPDIYFHLFRFVALDLSAERFVELPWLESRNNGWFAKEVTKIVETTFMINHQTLQKTLQIM